jgi:hypothetical protein
LEQIKEIMAEYEKDDTAKAAPSSASLGAGEPGDEKQSI